LKATHRVAFVVLGLALYPRTGLVGSRGMAIAVGPETRLTGRFGSAVRIRLF
jgi:hypothetical protein